MGKNIVLLGPPGAGKGTQGKRLAAKLREPHIASGDLFRALLGDDTDLTRDVKAYMARGAYVPDELTIRVVLGRLQQPDALDGFILDGFPRTEPQARALDRAMEGRGSGIDAALFINAPEEVLVERIARRYTCPTCHAVYEESKRAPKQSMVCDVCGSPLERRADDHPDVVRPRLRAYAEKTRPLIDYYRRQGKLVEINGSRPVEQVEHDVDKELHVVDVPQAAAQRL
ncbi:MAG: adenylate kinase [Chloroflexota bacterium]